MRHVNNLSYMSYYLEYLFEISDFLKKKKRKRFNQTTVLKYFKAKCEYKDPKTRKRCNSVENLTTHHKNGDPSIDTLENLEIVCLYHHRKIEGILHKKGYYR